MVGVTAAYLSDRIWTKWGRRKPFYIISTLGCAVLLFALPLVGSLWMLIVAIVMYQFFVDLNKPWEPLFNEVIPPTQRGRGGVFRMTSGNIGLLLFNWVLISQFDRIYEFATPFGALSGEMVLYWTVALVMLATGLFLLWFVEESPPPVTEENPPLSEYRPTPILGVRWGGGPSQGFWPALKTLFGQMFGSRQAVYVYALYACPILASTILYHPNYTLLYTEQLAMPKELYGRMTAISLGCMIVIFTPFAGYLADKVNRIGLMRFGILGASVMQLVFFLYLTLRTGEGSPPFVFLLSLSIGTSFFLAFLWAVWGPVVYDYVPSNKMGTYQAGIMFTSAMIAFVQTNMGGWWVKAWSGLFGGGAPGQNYDHSSILIMAFLIGLFALYPTVLFQRAERRGEIKPEGRLER